MTQEVTSYTELIAGIDAERVTIGLRHLDFEVLCGMTQGHWGKAAGMLQVKKLGVEKIFDALRAAGLRIRLEVDPEQRAKMTARIAQNFNPMQTNQARMQNHASPISTALRDRVFSHFLREGRKKRWQKVSKKARSEHAKKMANARWKKVRRAKKARRSGAAHRAANAALSTARDARLTTPASGRASPR